jgi:hypothetical protein
MQVKHISLFFFILFSYSFLNAQEVQKNDNGDQIIVNPDGSYVKFDKNNPQHRKLLKNKPEEQDVEKMAKQLRKLEREKATFQKNIEDKKNIENLLAEATENRLKAEKALGGIQKDVERKLASKGTLLSYEQQVKAALDKEKDLIKAQKEATIEIKNAKKEIQRIDEDMAKLSKTAVPVSSHDVEVIASETPANVEKNNGKKKRKEEDVVPMQSTTVNTDLPVVSTQSVAETPKLTKNVKKSKVYVTPTANCEIAFDGIDDFSKKSRKETKKALLFSETDDMFKNYVNDGDYITCDANMSLQSGSLFYLNFYFTIASDNTSNTFGVLEKGSPISVRLLNGDIIILLTSRTDRGIVDTGHKTTTYTAQCALGTDDQKKLKNGEIDFIRVSWGTGFEDYQIYDLDFVSRQMKCLMSAN